MKLKKASIFILFLLFLITYSCNDKNPKAFLDIEKGIVFVDDNNYKINLCFITFSMDDEILNYSLNSHKNKSNIVDIADLVCFSMNDIPKEKLLKAKKIDVFLSVKNKSGTIVQFQSVFSSDTIKESLVNLDMIYE